MSMSSNPPPIAVVGVSALFPGSVDGRGFWRDIIEGRDLIREVPESHWLIEDYYDPDPKAPDKTYCRRGGFLDKVPFDCMEFGTPPKLVQATDTVQLLALIVARKVLEDAAGGDFSHIDTSRMSCILGATGATELVVHLGSRLQRPIWLKALRDNGVPEDEAVKICDDIADHYVPWTEGSFPGLLGNVVAGRIANRFDLGGTNCVVDAACASSQSALAMGLNELYLGQSDFCITGGVDTLNDILMYMCFSKTPALSATEDCRPFSDKADGTILGEGLGMLALRRLEDAERDGDKVYAVIRGYGSSSDGRAKSVYAPRPEGQVVALDRAYEAAGYGPETVELVEAHGTGTKAGDAAEFASLNLSFDKVEREDRQWCALGSIKSQIGHTKGAAGAASLFKAVMALHHKVLPPTIKVDRPNPKLDIKGSPFYINTKARPWIRDSAHPRRASVSSFGFGGTNFHVALEEYAEEAPHRRFRPSPKRLCVWSAASVEALFAAAAASHEGLEDGSDELEIVERASLAGFKSGERCRLAVVATDLAELRARLAAAREVVNAAPHETAESPAGWFYGCGAPEGKVAFLFPGQGSQRLDMGAELAMSFDTARAVWDRAAETRLDGERAIHEVVFPIPVFDEADRKADDERLRSTDWAQPGIGVTSVSMLALLRELGLEPDYAMGHSFGELTALHCAGVYDEAGLLAVARKRGELMAAAADKPGAMTAVTRGRAEVEAALGEGIPGVVLANHNSPRQVVLSGPTEGIAAAEAKLKEAGLRFRRLPVATAFHSEIVSDASKPFGEFLAGVDFKAPSIPVLANSTADEYPTDPAAMRELLAGQIARPVRFVEQVDKLWDAGVRTFVEVGPGRVLSGLVEACLGDREARIVAMDRKGRHGVTSFQEALARLLVDGHALDLEPLLAPLAEVIDPRTVAKPRLAIGISGVNYDKPYPPKEGAAGLPKPNPPRARQAAPAAASPASNPTAPPAPASPSGGLTLTPPASSVPPAPVAPAQPSREPLAMPNPNEPARQGAYGARAEPDAAGAPRPAPASGEALQWVQAFQQVQQHTVDAHMAFLRVAERSLMGLESMVSGRGAVNETPTVRWSNEPAPAPSAPPAYELGAPPVNGNGHALTPPAPTPAARPAPVPAAAQASAPVPAPVAPAPIAAAPATGGVDLTALMLEIVAEKTGYPQDMLEMGMELESDLGIDSIKRVEILSAMQERVPSLPEVDPTEMASLATLDAIVGYMSQKLGGAAAPVGSSTERLEIEVPGSVAPVVAPVPAAGGVDLTALMLEIVAEKTGYPQDMLEMGMELESDLGIDSIKRVEILSAMQERVPSLPEVDPTEMASLATLEAIVGYMSQKLGGPAPAPAGAVPATGAPDGVDLTALMLEVVAEKTGYPQDMLEMGMELESDLGIDSIKRVEILSAMQERVPSLPEVDPTEMASLATLDAIVGYMQGALPGKPSAVAPDATGEATTAGIRRFEVTLEERPASGFRLPGLGRGRAVVTDGGTGLAAALCEELGRRGVAAEVVDGALPADASVVIALDGLAGPTTIAAALDIERRVFDLACGLAQRFESGAGALVLVQDTGGDYGRAGDTDCRAWLGGLSGLAKTAAQEWPDATVRSIDLHRGDRRPDEMAALLADELLNGASEREIGLDIHGRRLAPVSKEGPAPRGELPLSPGDVLVASGGARGVTAASLLALARECRPRLVLLGRTALQEEPAATRGATDDAAIKQALLADLRARGEKVRPAELGRMAGRIKSQREIRATIAGLEAVGSEVQYLSCDVSDPASVKATLDGVRQQWGPIHGLVHGAGVLADKLLSGKTREHLDRVFGAKVEGLETLLAALADDPLKCVALFSSVAARSGNAGQSDYAMANDILNRMAWQLTRSHPEAVVRSINWGPWESGMVTPALEAKFRELGVALIPLRVGAAMFVDELRGGPGGAVETVIGGPPQDRPLTAAVEARTLRFELAVDKTSHPVLLSHQVKQVPVVPLVLVAEWFSRAARAARPDLNLHAVKALRVLKGIRLEHFQDQAERFTVELTEQPSEGEGVRLAALLVDETGLRRYNAILEMGAGAPRRGQAAPSIEGAEVSLRGADLYGSKLFHGEGFAALRRIDRLGEDAARASLCGLRALDWSDEGWLLDPALLDGGLQVARIWGYERLGRPTLPTELNELIWYESGPIAADTPVRCMLSGAVIGKAGTRSDLWFVDGRDRLIAEIRGLAMHVTLTEDREQATVAREAR